MARLLDDGAQPFPLIPALEDEAQRGDGVGLADPASGAGPHEGFDQFPAVAGAGFVADLDLDGPDGGDGLGQGPTTGIAEAKLLFEWLGRTACAWGATGWHEA